MPGVYDPGFKEAACLARRMIDDLESDSKKTKNSSRAMKYSKLIDRIRKSIGVLENDRSILKKKKEKALLLDIYNERYHDETSRKSIREKTKRDVKKSERKTARGNDERTSTIRVSMRTRDRLNKLLDKDDKTRDTVDKVVTLLLKMHGKKI